MAFNKRAVRKDLVFNKRVISLRRMKMIFKRKRCEQCGWELGILNRQSFCSMSCASTWDKDKRESESRQRIVKVKDGGLWIE